MFLTCQYFVSALLPPGEGYCRTDCDGYRPDTLGGGIGLARYFFGITGTRG